jgi:broad specificity phosphatase PhoE
LRSLLVIRHGESDWNREGRWQGWEDIALNPVGEAQARARGAELHAAGHKFVAVFTSDLVRAARTAELIAGAIGAPPPSLEPGLRERFGGHWQGLTRDEMIAKWPEERAAWRRGELSAPPGGEDDSVVGDRVFETLATIDTVSPPGPVLVVTHHGVVRLLSNRAGVPLTELIPNLGGRWFDLAGATLTAGAALAPLAAAPVDGME